MLRMADKVARSAVLPRAKRARTTRPFSAEKRIAFTGQQLIVFGVAPTDDLTIEMWINTTMTGDVGKVVRGRRAIRRRCVRRSK